MKLSKITALIICVFMLAATLVGCKNEVDADADDQPVETPAAIIPPLPQNSGAETHSHDIDYEEAFAAFAPDTVMIRAGEYEITWAELYYNIVKNISGILQAVGMIHNWSETIYGDMTYADLVLDYAVENALMYKSVEYGASLIGVSVSESDLEDMEDEYARRVEQFGSEEALLSAIWEMDGISSRELFNYLMSIGYLASTVFDSMYGENGELVTDEDAAEHTAFDGYLMAKHILRFKGDEEDDDTGLAEAEAILELLDNYDGDDFEEYFDSLMWEHTDDGDGLRMFPNGYLFQYGDMVPQFYDACVALEIGSYSDIVEVEYGYHIVYRLPINFDEIPSYNYRQYDFSTLRYMVALDMFDSLLYGWMDSLELEYTAEYDSIVIARIFDIGEH